MSYNVNNSRVGDQDGNNVRSPIILKELERMAELFGRENWSIFEIFTLVTKAAEMGIEHAKQNRVGYPKTLTVTSMDGDEITLSVKKATTKAQLEQQHFNQLVDRHGKPQ